jgi:hypothetical protein
MKVGDLVKFKGPTELHPKVKYGMFLGLKTFKSHSGDRPAYVCSEVMWYPENKIKTVQSDLLEKVISN